MDTHRRSDGFRLVLLAVLTRASSVIILGQTADGAFVVSKMSCFVVKRSDKMTRSGHFLRNIGNLKKLKNGLFQFSPKMTPFRVIEKDRKSEKLSAKGPWTRLHPWIPELFSRVFCVSNLHLTFLVFWNQKIQNLEIWRKISKNCDLSQISIKEK